MRIAEISTLLCPVQPNAPTSVELLVYTITEGLVARGHDVTLFALPGSTTSAQLRTPVENSYLASDAQWNWQVYESYQVCNAFQSCADFDIIHCHSYYHGLLFCDFVPTPSLHSIHIEPGPDYVFLGRRVKNRQFHFCSAYQARDFSELDGVNIIPHGLDLNRYHICRNDRERSYLAYLGRFIEEKGPLEAIRFARNVGIPLKMAGEINHYFLEYVEPEIKRGGAEYVGELHGEQKSAFLAGARALVYPSQRGEPFGLVLIEAMASGAPVLALNKGAVSEIVEHGVTGWLGDTMEELKSGVTHLGQFNPAQIRRRAEERFAAEIMVKRLEQLMRDIVEGCNDD